MSDKKLKTALVTGANRGIGYEVSRQLLQKGINVCLGCRDLREGEAAKVRLHQETGSMPHLIELDVTRHDHIEKAREYIDSNFGGLDILINNAAVFLDPPSNGPNDLGDRSVLRAKPETIVQTFHVNTLGPLALMQAFVPGMRERNYGRVVNVSSGDGQLSDMNGGKPAYRLSKVSLNALTRIFADELKGTNVLVNSVCPGWVKTRMGGPSAKREVSTAVGTIIWLALLEGNGPQGGFFRDFKPLAW